MRKLLLVGLLTLMLATPGYCQSGLFIRPDNTSILNPIVGQSWLFDSTNKQVFVFNGSQFVQVTPPLGNFSSIVNPSSSNDNTQGYQIGSLWVNTATHGAFICASTTTSAAIWTSIGLSNLTQTFVTQAGETSTLPNSFTLAAGSNITLTPLANVLTIAASGGGGGGQQFGGNGNQGVLDVSSGITVFVDGQQTNYTNITVESGAQIAPGESGVLQLHATGTVLIQGTVECSGLADYFAVGTPASGLSGQILVSTDDTSTAYAGGGGGGGGAGLGGAGGYGFTATPTDLQAIAGDGGTGNPAITKTIGGNGGDGGSGNTPSNGGGVVIIDAVGAITVDVAGLIDCSGTGGGDTNSYGGSGGGGGGVIILESQDSITINSGGVLTVNGGDGGNTTQVFSGAGGGGSAGTVILVAPVITNAVNSVSVLLAGGAGGSATGSPAGDAGGSGAGGTLIPNIVSPTLPLF